ncbi:lonely Cys domain-containing protein, partial [Streptomyces sp. NPDC057717]|uniref:lonely Cys domain-containing protein n=1 Tax=Streptomyces sp. NPDC057717 TaxID=3346224 RepID=UPI00367CD826
MLPFFVVAQGGPGTVVVQLGNEPRTLSPEQFAGLLADDPGLRQTPPGTPVVLLVPFGGAQGLTLPRLVAARLGREVWSYSGRLSVQTLMRGGPQVMAHTRLGETEPHGTWILSRPADDLRQAGSENHTADVGRALDGQTFRHTDVVSHTIVGPDYRPVGRSAHTPPDQARREAFQPTTTTTTYYESEVLDDGSLLALPDGERAVPWAADIAAGRTPYIVSLHGTPDALVLPVRTQTVEVSGREVGRYLRRRSSVSQLAPAVPLVLAACHAGTPGTNGRATAQDVADETGHVVYAANAAVGETSRVGPAPDGRPGVWKRFNPHTRTPAPTAPATGPSPRQHRDPRVPTAAPWPVNSARRSGTGTFQLPPATGSGALSAGPVSTVLTAAGGQPVGRDYTPLGGRPAGVSSALVPRQLYTPGLGPDGRVGWSAYRAPWADSPMLPFFVVAQGGPGTVVVQLGNEPRTLSPEQFAGLLADDPGLRQTPPGTPVVLLVPFGGAQGLTLPRLVAARLGREVWSYSGRLSVQTLMRGGPQVMAHTRLGETEPHGTWILSRPADDLRQAGSENHTADVGRALDGQTFRHTDVVSHTIVGPDYRPVGRSAHTPPDQAIREPHFKVLAGRTRYLQGNPVPDSNAMELLSGTEREVPWAADIAAGRTPYFFATHGDPNAVALQVAGGRTIAVNGLELGRYLRRRPSLAQLHPDIPIVLTACSTGKTGARDRELPVAQIVANITARVVYAPNTTSSAMLSLEAGSDGLPGSWVKFEPDIGIPTPRAPATGPSPRQRRNPRIPQTTPWPANSARRSSTGTSQLPSTTVPAGPVSTVEAGSDGRPGNWVAFEPRNGKSASPTSATARLSGHRAPTGAPVPAFPTTPQSAGAPHTNSATAPRPITRSAPPPPSKAPRRREVNSAVDDYQEPATSVLSESGEERQGHERRRQPSWAPVSVDSSVRASTALLKDGVPVADHPSDVPLRREGAVQNDPFNVDLARRQEVHKLYSALHKQVDLQHGTDASKHRAEAFRLATEIQQLKEALSATSLAPFLTSPDAVLQKGLTARAARIRALRKGDQSYAYVAEEAAALNAQVEQIRAELAWRKGQLSHQMVPSPADIHTARRLVSGRDPVWSRVGESGAVRLVVAEQRAQRFGSRDRLVAGDRLRDMPVLARLYPVEDGGEREKLLEGAHRHLVSGMSLVSSVRLDTVAGGGSLFAALTAGPDVAVGEALARVAGGQSVADPRARSLPATLVSRRFQEAGTGAVGHAVIHWKTDVRRRAVHIPSGDDVYSQTGPGHGTTLSSLYPLLVHADQSAVRLALAEATGFEHDLELRRWFAAGRPAISSHFGALIQGDLRWSDVEKVVLTHGDDRSKQQAQKDSDRLQDFATRHRLTFQVSLAAVPRAVPSAGSGQDPGKPVSTVLTGFPGVTVRPVGRDYTPLPERPTREPSPLLTQDVHWAELKKGGTGTERSAYRAPW